MTPILVIQDTTEIDYTTQKSKSAGYLNSPYRKGFLTHSAIATLENGKILGLVDQYIWSRSSLGKSKDRDVKPIEEKESFRWLTVIDKLKDLDNEFIVVGDRESDIYDLFDKKRNENINLVVRSCYNRKTSNGKLIDTLNSKKAGITRIEISNGATAEIVKFEVRFAKQNIQKPKGKDFLPINTVSIKSIDRKNQIEWNLLTTLDVNSEEEALKIVDIYSKRWTIERFHFVLKSGCHIEDLQLKSEKSNMNAITVYSEVALKILELKMRVSTEPEKQVDFLDKEEEEMLRKVSKKTKKKIFSVMDAIMAIGSLGGFIGRKSDGILGVKVLWRGLKTLHTMIQTKKLLNTYG